MAALTDQARAELWAEFMQDRSAAREGLGGITKAELRAAVNGLDDFINTNAVAINNAIPQPARGALTTPQKALLLQFVVEKRYLTGT